MQRWVIGGLGPFAIALGLTLFIAVAAAFPAAFVLGFGSPVDGFWLAFVLAGVPLLVWAARTTRVALRPDRVFVHAWPRDDVARNGLIARGWLTSGGQPGTRVQSAGMSDVVLTAGESTTRIVASEDQRQVVVAVRGAASVSLTVRRLDGSAAQQLAPGDAAIRVDVDRDVELMLERAPNSHDPRTCDARMWWLVVDGGS